MTRTKTVNRSDLAELVDDHAQNEREIENLQHVKRNMETAIKEELLRTRNTDMLSINWTRLRKHIK